MAVRRIARCPPGVWCFSSGLGIFLTITVFFGALALLYYLFFKQNTYNKQNKSPIVFSYKNEKEDNSQPIQIFNNVESNGDDRYTRAPEPYRMWATVPDLRGAIIPPGAVPINMPTRYYPQQFQQMGILKTPDQQILPLFGRRTGTSTDRYNYYTRTDTYNPIQVPINYQRRDCMDDVGCNELLGGESIQIRGLDKQAHVEVYKYDAPRYIPSLI